MTTAFINRVATAVPRYEAHDAFIRFAAEMLPDASTRRLFERMVVRSQIERRWSCISPSSVDSGEELTGDGFYKRGQFPSTLQRMDRYEKEAPLLGAEAVARLELGYMANKITHLIVASCTGFFAPGIDLKLVERCGLRPSVERTIVGFMGCHAAINALRLAHHIVRSSPQANVLVVCLELCTLHLQETENLDKLLSFLLFADGCAAALVSSEPVGLALEGFHTELVQSAAEQITWRISDDGFDMLLSGAVPSSIFSALSKRPDRALFGCSPDTIDLWAVHPGGRSILDAVENALNLKETALAASRAILRDFGNMSSATILFVLDQFMRAGQPRGKKGCAIAFGPGLTAETMMFRTAA